MVINVYFSLSKQLVSLVCGSLAISILINLIISMHNLFWLMKSILDYPPTMPTVGTKFIDAYISDIVTYLAIQQTRTCVKLIVGFNAWSRSTAAEKAGLQAFVQAGFCVIHFDY